MVLQLSSQRCVGVQAHNVHTWAAEAGGSHPVQTTFIYILIGGGDQRSTCGKSVLFFPGKEENQPIHQIGSNRFYPSSHLASPALVYLF